MAQGHAPIWVEGECKVTSSTVDNGGESEFNMTARHTTVLVQRSCFRVCDAVAPELRFERVGGTQAIQRHRVRRGESNPARS